MSVEWSLTIIAISSLLLTAFAVLFFWQARKTAIAVESALMTLNARLPVILTKMEDVLAVMMESSQSVRAQIGSLAVTVARIRELSDFIFAYERALRGVLETSLVKAVRNVNAVKIGLSAFLSNLSGRKRIDCR